MSISQTSENLIQLNETERELKFSRALVERMTVGRRAWWMYVGAIIFYGAVTLVQLILHGSTS